jgi:REP element-mobilizing transposase RayT
MTDDIFALHITWSTYGTWLPGDRRGHVSNVLLPGGGFAPKQNTFGTPVLPGDPYTQERARALQQHKTVWLTCEQALIVAHALVEAARTRSWRILRAAIMSNHMHVVITDCPADGPADGPAVRRILKGNSDAKLRANESRRWWTAGGSDRRKFGAAAVEAAITYVADQQGKLAEIIDMEVAECQ